MFHPEGGNSNIQVSIPNECPLCHHNIVPMLTGQAVKIDSSVAELPMRCTRLECNRLFIGRYRDNPTSVPGSAKLFKLEDLVPKTAEQTDFPEAVKKVSPNFVAIHGQAMQAESYQLD